MEECKIKNLFSLENTIAKSLLEKYEYPWEVLSEIKKYIIELGNTLSEDEYDKIGENIWVAKTAKVAKTAYLNGPLIICDNAKIKRQSN